MLKKQSFYILLLFLGLQFPLLSFSKSKEYNGFVVKQNSDTLFGVIKDNGLRRNTISVEFRSEEATEYKEYTIENIKAFRFSNKFYVEKKTEIENESVHQFVEFLVDGVVDLYYLKYKKRLYYLLEKENGDQAYINVNFGSVKSEQDLNSEKQYRKENIAILKKLMGDYPDIWPKVETVYFENKRSVNNLIADYHNQVCADYSCVDYMKNYEKSIMWIGAGYSIGQPTLTFVNSVGDYFDYLMNGTAESLMSHHLGLYYSFTIPTISNKLAIRSRLEYFSENYTYRYHEDYALIDYKFVSSFNFNIAALIVDVSYRFGETVGFFPYVGAGFNYIHNYSSEVSVTPEGNQFDKKAITLAPLMIDVVSGISVELPLIKSQDIFVRPSIEYRYSLIQEVSDIYTEFNYKHSSIAGVVTILHYF